MQYRLHYFGLLCGALLAYANAGAEPQADEAVAVDLQSSMEVVTPGSAFTVALRMDHAPGWHSYWKNPGESGLPTTIEWDLPEGWSAGPIRWPVPQRFDEGGLTTLAYADVVYLLVDVTVPAEAVVGTDATLSAGVDWLQCKQICLPGEADLSLQVRVGSSAKASAAAAAIREAEAWVPVESGGYDVGLSERASGFEVRIRPTGDHAVPAIAAIFPEQAGIDVTQSPVVRREGDAVRFDLLKTPVFSELEGGVLALVVRAEDGQRFDGDGGPYALRFEVEPGAAAAVAASGGPGLAGLLLLALGGGLILNLMPCVFPVLGIKIMGFVNQAGESRGRVAIHGLVFTAGVLISFWLLAGLLLVLRSAGNELGWGFQLQSANFVYLLTVVLLAFALNMSGVFEFGLSAVGVGSDLTAQKGFSGSFFSGALATLVATPCAAPFLAPALGSALILPPAQSILVFTVIGIGLSAPYLLLTLFPSGLKWLPRPGAWMDTFKKLMAFLLYATVAFLLWVLVGLTGEAQQLRALMGLVLVALACWIYGHWAVLSRPRTVRLSGTSVAIAALLGAGVLGLSKPSSTLEWEPWSEARVRELVAAGRPVYVDFTARWCPTCQVNKRVVFGSEAVKDYIAARDVALLKADWTRRDPEITKALARYGRQAVPFNLIHLPGVDEAIVLPEVLTPGIVLDAFRGGGA